MDNLPTFEQLPKIVQIPICKILTAFFRDNNVASLASNGDFIEARDPINPDYWAYSIAKLALKYLYSLG